MLRVLHVFKTYLPDDFRGVERVIHSIAEASYGEGVQSRVLALSVLPSAKPIEIGTHLVHQAKQDLYLFSTGLSASVFSQYRALARDADIVHFHYPWPLMDLLYLSSSRKPPSIVTYHSDIVKQGALDTLYGPLRKRFLSKMDRLVATSPNYLATSPVLRDFAGKTIVIPIGIDAEAPKVTPTRMRYWMEKVGRPFLLFVGAPRYYKGLHFLFEAARVSGVRVVLAGCSQEQLQNAGYDCPPSCIAVGEVSDEDKEALLHLSSGLVLPSHLRSEAFGVVLLEASRAGRAMISCEIGTGTTYVNQNGVTGLAVAPADARELAGAMRRLIDDPPAAEQMGKNARKRFHALFESAAQGRAYADLYKQIARDERTALPST